MKPFPRMCRWSCKATRVLIVAPSQCVCKVVTAPYRAYRRRQDRLNSLNVALQDPTTPDWFLDRTFDLAAQELRVEAITA